MPVPPLAERIITIDTDRLLPQELTLEEIQQLLDTVDSVHPAQEDREKLHREDWRKKLKLLNDEFRDNPIPLSRLKNEEALFDDEDIDIFDHREAISITLCLVTDKHAEKQVKFWKKRFEKEVGRTPNNEEVDLYLHPGYQLFVGASDEETKASLTRILESKGFPVSQYRGLERDEDLFIDDKAEEKPELFLGRPGGAFRKIFYQFYSELTQGIIAKMQLEGKMPQKLAAKLIADEEARKRYVLNLTVLAFAEEMLKHVSPNTPDHDLDFLTSYLKAQLLMRRI